MQQSIGAWTVGLAAAGLMAGAGLHAQQQDVDGAAAVLPWAYVLNDPNVTADPVDPDEVVTVPGSSVSMPRSAINIDNGPPDWHPDAHPPMPEVVARGGGEGVVACGYCHLPNGQGKPENAGVAGQPYEYIVQQMTDWRNGLRRPGEPRQGPTAFMERIGLATTDEEARIAAEYFASIDFKPWVRVVETDAVPVTRFAGWIHEVVEGGGVEPIGTRVVETPVDLARNKLRDDSSGFIAYVPSGAVGRGRRIVLTGADNSVACTLCHGPDLRGIGPVPALAGRSPSYMARQLYDLQTGARNGAWSDLMDAAVANLTVEDIVDIVAYTASLEP
ncbi:MAG: cytochrome C-binding protein [Acidobacteria bacterium]|nr:cytochrome C-binding protein [Acidobacteriota bacterium]